MASTTFVVGDVVTVSPRINTPSGGWGGVSRGDVGVVRSLNRSTGEVYVDFSSQRGWKGLVRDLVLVSEEAVSKSQDSQEQRDRELALALEREEQRLSAASKSSTEAEDRKMAVALARAERQQHQPLPTPRLARQPSDSLFDKRMADETAAAEVMSVVVATCMQNGEKFVDPEFPPNEYSLFGPSGKSHKRARDGYNGMPVVSGWRRISEIRRGRDGSSNRPALFVGTPSAEDINQGALGDCYFLSALAVVASREELLRRIIVTEETNHEAGAYQVRLCKDGAWTIVLIDDVMPVTQSGQLAFASGSRGQMWPALIEKAFAKACGSFAATESGQCAEALRALTGAPCDHIIMEKEGSESSRGGLPPPSRKVGDLDQLWVEIDSCQSAEFLMACSCGGDANEARRKGLSTSHAYSLIAARSVRLDDGTIARVVQLRNPWGRNSWTGDWSDASPQWNSERVRTALEYYGGGNEVGVFWMSLVDFFHYFRSIDICRVRSEKSGWSEVRVRFPLMDIVSETGFGGVNFKRQESGAEASSTSQRPMVYHLEVFQGTTCEFSMYQKDERWSGKGRGDVSACLGLLVLRAAKHGYGFLTMSHCSPVSAVQCDAQLEAGKYMVIPIVFNADGIRAEASDGVLAVHSSCAVTLSKGHVHAEVVARGLLLACQRKGKADSTGASNIVLRTLFTGSGGAIVAAENRGFGTSLTVELDCSDCFNLTTSRGSLITQDVIPEGHFQILQILSVLESGAAVQYKSQTRIRTQGTFGGFGGNQEGGQHQPGVSKHGLHAPVRE